MFHVIFCFCLTLPNRHHNSNYNKSIKKWRRTTKTSNWIRNLKTATGQKQQQLCIFLSMVQLWKKNTTDSQPHKNPWNSQLYFSSFFPLILVGGQRLALLILVWFQGSQGFGWNHPATQLSSPSFWGLDVKRLLKLSTLHVRFPWPGKKQLESYLIGTQYSNWLIFPTWPVTTVGMNCCFFK